jgi:arylsulfatase A-like enzyme/Flp pilus assembly protein TadD
MAAAWLRTTAALGVAVLFASPLAGCPGVVQTESRPPATNVVLITWDTAGADHVGPGAAVAGLTPRWNQLAVSGTEFELARTPTPLTLPAHASLLTGLLPSQHGARDNALFSLATDVPTLAERLNAEGWRTAAFVSAAVLDARYGLGRGFATYDDRVGGSSQRAVAERRADATVDAVLAWLSEVPESEAVFLWVHLFDPHLPWRAPGASPPRRENDGYRAEIAYTDAQTGRLLDGLRRLDRLERSLVVLTSDHGEGLGDHGERLHGYFAYDSTVRVPLAMWAGPKSGIDIPAGLRVAEPVSLPDVTPTVVDLLGLGAWPGAGRSLRPLLCGEPWPARELALENVDPAYMYGSAPIFGVVDRRGHTWFDLPQRERYDVAADPHQERNVYEPSMAAEADALFDRHPQQWPPASGTLVPAPEQAQRLAALGYLPTGGFDVAAVDPASAAAPDPKELLPVAQLWMNEHTAVTPAQALERAERLVERFGPLPALAFYLADRLLELGRRTEAIATLETAALANPREKRLQEELARLRSKQAADAELALQIRSVRAENPDHPGAVRDLATVLHRMGELGEAESLYRTWLSAHPEDDAARVALHRLLGSRGELAAALRVLRDGSSRAVHDPVLDCAEGRLLAWWMERTRDALAPLLACREAGQPLGPRELALLDATR